MTVEERCEALIHKAAYPYLIHAPSIASAVVRYESVGYFGNGVTYLLRDDYGKGAFSDLQNFGEASIIDCSMTYGKGGRKRIKVDLYYYFIDLMNNLEEDFSFAGVWSLKRDSDFLKRQHLAIHSGFLEELVGDSNSKVGCGEIRIISQKEGDSWKCESRRVDPTKSEYLELPDYLKEIFSEIEKQSVEFIAERESYCLLSSGAADVKGFLGPFDFRK